jgi:hypothetical protein
LFRLCRMRVVHVGVYGFGLCSAGLLTCVHPESVPFGL